ncbi:MAG: DegT/DnrJ/EryC1/StrS family aminotransferase [Nocardioides sp.]|uniref:DegT/DnrJ/EryC1/StrS family aminotransferase n=1 Tax=Nocardioides sp. TaxID=35761 RepID=UPI0039E2D336
MTIPFFSSAATFEQLRPAILERLAGIIDRDHYVDGAEARGLERDIAEYTGARHAVACGSGTDALLLLLAAAGVGPGAEVIVPAFTFFASASAVSLLGARPAFADIEPVSYGLDPAAISTAITPSTMAVMPVHLFTQPADMDGVTEAAAAAGLDVLEDSAEGIGMRYGGVHTGLIGRGGVLSFFPSKTLGAVGDAGMVLTDDDQLAAGCRRLAAVGMGGRMDEIQAAVLRERMTRLDADIRRRCALAAELDERLAPLAPAISTPRLVDRRSPVQAVYYVYLIQTDDKSGLVRHLTERGIGTEEYYPRPLHLQPCFAGLGYQPGDFPVAERASGRTVGLPFYPDLNEDAVDRVVAALTGFVESRGVS